MNLVQMIIVYFCALLIFFAIDLVWLGVVPKNFYKRQLGFIMSEKVNWTPAVVFYMLYTAGVLYFAVVPAVTDGTWTGAAVPAAILGLLCYGTYDLSNLATLKGWPVIVTVVDILWGMTITTAVSLAGFFIGSALV